MKHSGIRLAGGILILLLVVGGAGGVFVWIKMAAFKGQLADSLGAALGAKVEVSSLSLDLWKGELHAAGITLTNQRPDAPWDRGEISQATVRFHLRDLVSRVMPLSVEVAAWSVVLHSRTVPETPGASLPAPETAPAESPSSSRIQVTQLTAHEGEVEFDAGPERKMLMHGVSFDSSSNGGPDWTTHLQASSISAGSLQLDASSVELHGEPGRIAFSNLRMQCAQGMITGEGETALDGRHESRVSLKAVDVPVTMLVSVKWQMKLSGLASGTVVYQGNDQAAEAHGQLALTGGKFNVLPFLGKMTALVGLPDITGVEVDQATTDFAWQNGVLHLTNIDIRKNDVTRIAGQVDVDAASQVDGHLKLGLPVTVLSRWVPLQTSVFPDTHDGYDWADVHLTGTPDHLQEDLTSRVVTQGVQSGGDMLNQGAQKAMDLLKSFMGP